MPPKLQPPGSRGPFWYLRGTIDGRAFEVSTGATDRAGAEKFAAEYLRREGGAAGTSLGFRDAVEAFIAWRRPKNEDCRLLSALADWFGTRRLSAIRHADLVGAANALYPRGAPATKNRKVITPAAAVLHYAADQGWCEYRRFRKFPVPRRSPRLPASDATMRLLLANTDGPKRLLLALLYETGLRISDALRISWPDIDLVAARLEVQIAKTDERAALPLSPTLLALLAAAQKHGFRVFPWSSRMSVYRWLRPLTRQLGVTYTPHLSRHALATWMLEQGIPDRQAAEQGVWRDPRSLHRYQHARPADIGRSVAAISPAQSGERPANPLKTRR